MGKIKGKATIELFDAKTGELVEKHEETNMVTNWYSDMITPNGINSITLFDLETNHDLENYAGGVLCFANSIEENADNYGIPFDNPMTAHGAKDIVYTGVDLSYGSYSSESSDTASSHERKFVWDWNSDQGNGVIGSVCLTSVVGGMMGCGSKKKVVEQANCGNFYYRKFKSYCKIKGGYSNDEENPTTIKYGSILHIDKENNKMYRWVYNGGVNPNLKFYITVLDTCRDKFNPFRRTVLNDEGNRTFYMYSDCFTVVDRFVEEIEVDFSSIITQYYPETATMQQTDWALNRSCPRCFDKDSVWIIFHENNDGWIYKDKYFYAFQFDVKTGELKNHYKIKNTTELRFSTYTDLMELYHFDNERCFVLNNILYFTSYNDETEKYSFTACNLATGEFTEVTDYSGLTYFDYKAWLFIPWDDDHIVARPGWWRTTDSYRGWLLFSKNDPYKVKYINAYWNLDGIEADGWAPRYGSLMPYYDDKFLLTDAVRTGSTNITTDNVVSTFMKPLYLFTINNLSTPVTKTADKTMRITYVLTDATEE